MGANNNDIDAYTNETHDDRHMKKLLLVDTLAKKCASSSHKILQRIHRAVNVSEDGSQLVAEILTGGYTNYSYKVYVDKHPELCVFAKLCFDHALWNPDRSAHYDLKRTENEYEIMKTISTMAPDCVVPPLACWDLEHDGQNMKLLVTEWSQADEQFGNQMIDGAVDPRIAPKIADTLATLHCIKDFEPSFNENVRPCMENMLEQMRTVAREASSAQNPKDRTEAYCASLGEDALMGVIDSSIADYHSRDCLIHSDAHAFNMLVEAKPSVEELNTFGPNGTFVLCDWEMAMAGPVGRDIGSALSVPVGCVIAHALNGNKEAIGSIQTFINTLIDAYCSRMIDEGRTPADVAAIFRNSIGWCGWVLYLVNYVLHIGEFPMESKESESLHRDALGVLGLKLLRCSYDTKSMSASAGSEEVRKVFDSILHEEVERAQAYASQKNIVQRRKSSLLRAANRRLSDTAIFVAAESVKRLSVSNECEVAKRLSIAEHVSDSGTKRLPRTEDIISAAAC